MSLFPPSSMQKLTSSFTFKDGQLQANNSQCIDIGRSSELQTWTCDKENANNNQRESRCTKTTSAETDDQASRLSSARSSRRLNLLSRPPRTRQRPRPRSRRSRLRCTRQRPI